MRKKLLSILALLCLTVTSAWADGTTVNLATLKDDYTATSGDILQGTTNHKVTIAAGATVTLSGANISSSSSSSSSCLVCLGDATIILDDGTKNELRTQGEYCSALMVGPEGTTLTIQGSTGELKATSDIKGAGIGGGYSYSGGKCGNIVIQGGVITAQGGMYAPGIGPDNSAHFGNITISGGTVTATGGNDGAGIGTGNSGSCGDITITADVTKVTATKGYNATHSIGGYNYTSCGTVRINGVEGAISESPYIYTKPSVSGSGNCGTNVTWKLTSDGVLTISGTGAMADYAYADSQPWRDNRSDIKAIVINEGVTSIGKYAFSNCESATSISIPASVTCIGNSGFFWCTNISSLTIAANSSLTTIDSYAFYCAGFGSVTIPAGVTSIGSYAFDCCTNLTTVILNSNPYIGESAFNSAVVKMNLTANSASGAYWTTFYNENYSFIADEYTKVFKVTLSGDDLTMHEVADRIVNAGTAVVLKSQYDDIDMTLTSSFSDNVDGNDLKGVSDPAVITNDGTCYVLNNGTGGVGFYKLASGKTPGVGKAYLTYSGSVAAAREYFLFGEATGIEGVSRNDGENGEVYDLQGRRVIQPTKGLYIVNGKKVIFK